VRGAWAPNAAKSAVNTASSSSRFSTPGAQTTSPSCRPRKLAVTTSSADIRGTALRSLSHKYEANWSPDGHWLAFSANTGGTIQVWRIPVSEEPNISPDGRWLVYNKGGGGASLWMLTLGRDATQ
jgi:Tol biopolymer transport system component